MSEEYGTRLRASAGSAIKEPTFFENFATGFATGNPDLDPEQSTSWEVGVEQALASERLRLHATWFDQSFKDLIQYTFAPPAAGDPNFFNVAAAEARGLELVVDAIFGPLRSGASWTRVETKVTDSGFDEGEGATFVDGQALLRRPKNTVALDAAVDVSTVDVSARYVHVGDRSDRDFATFPATPVTLDGYGLLSLAVQWAAVRATDDRPGLTLLLRGENLLDSTYQEAFGFAAPGRGLYVGGSFTLGGVS